MEENIPKEYLDYADVFSEEKAKRFPPKREEDHEINFTKEVPKSFDAYTYKMDKHQTTFLRKWIDEEMSKGFIRESKSPYPSPTFLIKKKNGDYRVVQDYQKLNAYTIPDKTPLPLIADLIEQLGGKTLFTKFNIQVQYQDGIQQHQDQRRGPGKSGIHHSARTIRTHGDEFWIKERPGNLHEDDELTL